MARVLVIAETDGASISESTRAAVDAAQRLSTQLGSGFDILLAGGASVNSHAEEWIGFGAETVWLAESSSLAHPTTDVLAYVCVVAAGQSQADYVVAPSSSFGRDLLPRVAALLDLPMLSDVVGLEVDADKLRFKRPMYAGNLVATVELEGTKAALSIRATAFGGPEQSATPSPVRRIDIDEEALPTGAVWISLESAEQKRPELTSARVVVSGGRPLRDAETFERLLGGLADKLGGAVGATRAAVDSGIAPNELQVGQTGKVVAPELYIAVGVSGSVQHLAGMKDSKVIVAINTDPDAPIFEVADYGLVADLYQAVPEMMQKLG